MTNEMESLRIAVNELPRTGTTAYRIPGCEPEDDDRYTDPLGLANIKDRLAAAGVEFCDASEYSKAITFGLDGQTINILWASPDSLSVVGLSRRVADRWRATLEFAADARAVGDDEARALSLVSALVKVARLAPAPHHTRVPLLAGSHFYEGALLAARIDRLLKVETWRRQSFAMVPVWPVSLVGLTLLAALLPSQTVWLTVHVVTEGLIRVLP
jgi:hypothetical protein